MSEKKEVKLRASLLRSFLVFLPLILFVGMSGIFISQMWSGRSNKEIPSALIGQTATPLVLAELPGLIRNGKQVPGISENFKSGVPKIVNIWASWCVPCRLEHPILMELAKSQEVELIGVNYKDSLENALRFLGALGNPFSAVGADPNGKIAIEWGTYGIPETFVVAGDGTIIYKHVGPLTPQSINTRIMPALREARKKSK